MISYCKGCVPPKRTPTCKFDGTCNKYAEAKAIHDAELERINKIRKVSNEIYSQRGASVRKAYKRKKRR